MIRVLVALSFAVLLGAGCDPAPCVRRSDCAGGLVCSAGACVAPPTDGEVDPDAGDAPMSDAGLDAPLDASIDADLDAAGIDAELDAAIDDAPIDDAGPDDAPIDDAPIDDAPIDDAGTDDAG